MRGLQVQCVQLLRRVYVLLFSGRVESARYDAENGVTSSIATHNQLTMAPPSDEELAVLFKEFDTSGDGYISFQELMAALKRAARKWMRTRRSQSSRRSAKRGWPNRAL